MTMKNPREIWSEQFEAAQDIKIRFGIQAAFDYIVAEKLMIFAEAARQSVEFARELPSFVAAVRSLFQPEQMLTNLARLEETLTEIQAYNPVDDDWPADNPEVKAGRLRQFAVVKELLSVRWLGTA